MEKSLKSSFDWIVGFAGFLLPIAASAEFSFEGTGSYANADTTFTEQELYNGSISWFLAPVMVLFQSIRPDQQIQKFCRYGRQHPYPLKAEPFLLDPVRQKPIHTHSARAT